MKRNLTAAFSRDEGNSVRSNTINEQSSYNHQGLTSSSSFSSLQSGRTSTETGMSSRSSEESLYEGEYTETNTVKAVVGKKTYEEIVEKTFRMSSTFRAIQEDGDASYPYQYSSVAATDSKEAPSRSRDCPAL